jgi:hypothetical protein
MDLGNTKLRMVHFTKESGSLISRREMDRRYGLMYVNTKDNLKMDLNMG